MSNSVFAYRVRANWLCGLLACAVVHPLHAAPQAVSQADYDAAIQAARNGQLEIALQKLQAWRRDHPADLRIAYDLAVVLGMAGQHQAALQYERQILDSDAPAYALKAVADSLRAAGRAADAETVYKRLLAKTPEDATAHAGLVYCWMAQDRLDQALAHVRSRLPSAPARYRRDDLPLLVALAELHEKRGEWLLAATTYQDVLHFDPDFRYAYRGRVFALSRAGVAYLAKKLADARPQMFSDAEQRQLAHDAAARTVILGQAQQALDDKPTRYAVTDRALAENAEAGRRFGESPAIRFDRLVALRDRLRMREAVALYESLRDSGIDIPPYARSAAADAYLYLEQPQMARDLYLTALKDAAEAKTAAADDWRIALMYAYGEAEQHEEAQQLADQVLRNTPDMRYKGVKGVEAPNPDYARASLMTALTRMYADRLAAAESRLQQLRALAPFHPEIRAAWASLQAARERPRAALDEFDLLLADEPKLVGAAVGRAEVLMTLNRHPEARTALAALQQTHADNKGVQNLARKLEIHDRLHLKIETTLGRGAATAGAESTVDVTLHSRPLTGSLGENLRVFSHVTRSQGAINGGGSLARARVGAGIDYRTRDLSAEAQVNHAFGAAGKSGLGLALSWDLSDAWRTRLALDTNLNDLPAIAFRDGITGKSLKLDMTWVQSESRKAGGGVGRLEFSDGNRRNLAHAWWRERWIAGPAFKLETLAEVSASSNNLANRNYFNPERDREANLTVSAEWLALRRYQFAFRHRLALTLGRYRQAGFAGGATADLRYEHEWRTDDSMTILYGLGHGFHPYDGAREQRNYGYFNLFWAIP